MATHQPLDRLSGLIEKFRIRVQLSYSGTLCGVNRFDASKGVGYLHVLRRGTVRVTHPGVSELGEVELTEPSLLFYPHPLTHQFHNPPKEESDFTCAAVLFDGGERHPIVRALPTLIQVPLHRVTGLEPALDLLFSETDRVQCGQRVLADRLFEVVLIQLLRWLLDHPETAGIQSGLIMGFSDPYLALALVAMHDAPGRSWSLESLAATAGVSRTRFATRFKSVVGQTPADYLTDWRMELAKAGLKAGRPMGLLANELGYANGAGLSRAFTSKNGISPRAWLKREQSGINRAPTADSWNRGF